MTACTLTAISQADFSSVLLAGEQENSYGVNDLIWLWVQIFEPLTGKLVQTFQKVIFSFKKYMN